MHDAEIRQVSAERDAMVEQSKAEQVQCQQQLAALEALRQELAAAHEGRAAATVGRRDDIWHPFAAIHLTAQLASSEHTHAHRLDFGSLPLVLWVHNLRDI